MSNYDWNIDWEKAYINITSFIKEIKKLIHTDHNAITPETLANKILERMDEYGTPIIVLFAYIREVSVDKYLSNFADTINRLYKVKWFNCYKSIFPSLIYIELMDGWLSPRLYIYHNQTLVDSDIHNFEEAQKEFPNLNYQLLKKLVDEMICTDEQVLTILSPDYLNR